MLGATQTLAAELLGKQPGMGQHATGGADRHTHDGDPLERRRVRRRGALCASREPIDLLPCERGLSDTFHLTAVGAVDRFGENAQVAGRHHRSGHTVADQILHAGVLADDHRHSAGDGLNRCIAEAIGVARMHI